MMNLDSSNAEQRSPEWFKHRSGRVTASIVGAILGLSPFMTKEDARKILDGKSEFKGNQATEWGVFNEEGAIKQFEMETGLKVKKATFVPYEDWLGASPDGYVSDESLIEVKCPFVLRKGGDFKSINEQPQYFAQMQIQMLCCNKESCYFYQWSPFGSMTEIVKRDDVYLSTILPVLRNFYYGIEDEENPLVDEYFKNKALINSLTDRQKELLELIVKESNEEKKDFGSRKLYKVEKEGSISYAKAFKDLMPEADLSKYKGEKTEYWVLK
jgi:putative phage-type endonuclease